MPETPEERMARLMGGGATSVAETPEARMSRLMGGSPTGARATPEDAASVRASIFGSADPDSQPAPDEVVNAVLDLHGHGSRVEAEIAKYSKELDRGSFPGIFKPSPSEQAIAFERMGAEGYRKAERGLAIERMGGVPTLGRARQMLSAANYEARVADEQSKIRQSENPILRYGARLAVGAKEQLENAGAYVRENLIRPAAPGVARALDALSASAGMSEEGKAVVREDTKGLLGDAVEMVGQTAAFIPQVALGGVPGAAAVSTAASGGDVMVGVETAAFLKTAGALTKLFGGASESVVRQVLAEGGSMTAAGVAMRLGFHGDPGTLQQAGVDALSGLAFGVMGGGARAREAAAKFKAALEGGKTLEAAAAESGIPAERLKVPPVPEAAWMREAKFDAAKNVMPTETPTAPRLPDAGKPLPVPETPILEVPDVIVTTKRGPPGPKVVEAATKRAEAAAPVNEAMRRFEERTGIRVGQEPTVAEKPVSEAPKAPAEAPRVTPKAEPAPVEAVPPPVEAPRPEGVSIKNAAVEADRAARGADPLPKTAPEKMADWKDEAVRRVEENPNYPVELIDNLKRTGRPHDKVEAAALTVHRVKLNESLAKAEADVLKAAERGDLDAIKEAKIRADNLRAQDYEVSELVGKAAGAEAARALGARAMALDAKYELLPMETARRVQNDGAPLTEAQKAETKAIHDEMAALRKKVAEYEARKGGGVELLEGKRPDVPKVSVADVKGAEYGRRNTIVTREKYDAARAAIREKFSRMSAGIDPTALVDLAKIGAFHIEAGARSFASWSKAMVSDLGDKVTPHLREVWRAAQIEMGEPGQGDPKRLAALKSRLRTRIADREARMAMGKMENAPKREPVKRDAEAIRLEAERDMIERKWQRALMKDAWERKSLAQKAGSLAISGTRNLSRALMTAWDFSAPLRQGAILTASHPIKAAKAMGAMFRAFRSPEHQAMIEAEMRLDPKYGEAKRAGLFLSEHADAATAKMEENLVSGWIEKIPGVGASQRAYMTFLNKLRFDVFKGGLENLSAAKEATPAEARAWANFINVATGRGGPQNAPKMDAAFNALNNAFFAPRLAYSRFQILFGTPMWRGTAASRKMIAMEYARSMTGLAIVYGLSQLVGGKIEKDGKVRFGNSVLDPTAGLASASKLLQQTMPGMARAVTGARRENQGFGRGDEVTAIGRYLRGKLAPLPGSALNLMSGKDPVGKPVTLGSEAVNLTTPMSYRDIYLAMKEHGVPKGAALGVLALFGMGLQNYRKKGG